MPFIFSIGAIHLKPPQKSLMAAMIELIISLLLLARSSAAGAETSQKLSSCKVDFMSRFTPAGNSVFLDKGTSSMGLSCVLFWPMDVGRFKPGGGGICSAAAADDDAAAPPAGSVVGAGSFPCRLAADAQHLDGPPQRREAEQRRGQSFSGGTLECAWLAVLDDESAATPPRMRSSLP